MSKFYLLGFSVFILMLHSVYAANEKPLIFKINVYKTPACKGKLAGPPIRINTSKTCNSYSYVDSKNRTINGSQNHLRCYKDKIVFDRYPFSNKCIASESYYQGKQFVEKNDSLEVGQCHQAASHDGFVYEKLSGYHYPGNEDCTTRKR